MKEIAQELGIDTELVIRDLEFHRGVGAGYLSQIEQGVNLGRWEVVAFAATAFRRAASHALILDQAELATALFADSAKCYDRLHRPYSAMMWSVARNQQRASASSDRSLLEFATSEGRYPSERFGELAYPLLFERAAGFGREHTRENQGRDGRFRRVVDELTALSTTPLGIMGIPIASYLNLATSMEEEADPHDVQYYLLPFLNAYALALDTARSKKFHWRRLLMPFHPIEPDILSVLFASSLWLKRHGVDLTGFIRERTEYRLASKLLSEALERMQE